MARLTRKSTVLDTARRRFAGFKQIKPKPDFAPPLTEDAFEAEVNGYSADLDAYNGDIAALDDKTDRLDARERQLADLSQRLFAAVKGKYGPDSIEVELLGGVRRSDRKKRRRTAKTKGGPASNQ